MISKQCKEHLKEEGKTGREHMIHALMIAVRLQCLIPALIIHSIFPSLFKMTASNTMSDILGDKILLDEHWDLTRNNSQEPLKSRELRRRNNFKWYNDK